MDTEDPGVYSAEPIRLIDSETFANMSSNQQHAASNNTNGANHVDLWAEGRRLQQQNDVAGAQRVYEKILLISYADPTINHQTMARFAADILLYKYQLDGAPTGSRLQDIIASMATDELWLNYLGAAINTNAILELLFIEVRSALLLEWQAASSIPTHYAALMAALALQAFANEYVFSVTEVEIAALARLQQPASELYKEAALLLGAMYSPLSGAGDISALRASPAMQLPFVNKLIERTVTELEQEEQLRSNIEPLSPVVSLQDDAISQKVRAQYEENPYPRWQAPPAPKHFAMQQLLRRQPGFQPQAFLDVNINVLVAGCGTGYEPIDIARMDNSLKLTAVDLSSRSLAYGMRMARNLGVDNIRFYQGDILNLHLVKEQFGLVICSGVLHHMANPAAGWRQLCERTKPGGVLRISLYSELARRRVVRAREQIAALGLTASVTDIRQFRSKIFSGELGLELSELTEGDDFFSMSACRDLLFHVQEHRFTFTQIAALIEELGLRLIGMDLPHDGVAAEFLTMFSEGGAAFGDLHNWAQFEARYPDTFVSMYHLWCQKAV